MALLFWSADVEWRTRGGRGRLLPLLDLDRRFRFFLVSEDDGGGAVGLLVTAVCLLLTKSGSSTSISTLRLLAVPGN